MKIKRGVQLAGLKLPMRKVLKVAEKIWANKGKELVVTSGLDGTHSAGSLHYYGYALDFRTWYFTPAKISSVVFELRRRLGMKYYVAFEKNHIHVHYIPAVQFDYEFPNA